MYGREWLDHHFKFSDDLRHGVAAPRWCEDGDCADGRFCAEAADKLPDPSPTPPAKDVVISQKELMSEDEAES